MLTLKVSARAFHSSACSRSQPLTSNTRPLSLITLSFMTSFNRPPTRPLAHSLAHSLSHWAIASHANAPCDGFTFLSKSFADRQQSLAWVSERSSTCVSVHGQSRLLLAVNRIVFYGCVLKDLSWLRWLALSRKYFLLTAFVLLVGGGQLVIIRPSASPNPLWGKPIGCISMRKTGCFH